MLKSKKPPIHLLRVAVVVAGLSMYAGSGGALAAAQLPAGAPLSLEQALSTAFQNSPEFRLATDQVAKSRGAVDEAESRFKPNVRTGLSWTYMEPEALNQTRNRPVANVTASLPLDIFHQLGYTVDLVKTQSEMQSLTRGSAAARLILNVKNAYYGLLRAYGRRDVSQAAVTYAQAQVADAVAKHENGIVPMFDVTTAQVNLANLNQQLIAAQSQIGIAQAALARVLGIDPSTPVEVAPAGVSVGLTNVDVAKGVEEAYAGRPEVQASQAAVNLARTNVKLQKTAAYPAVSLTGGSNYVFDSPVPGFDGLTWQVGASVSLPVMDGGAVAAKVRQAGADLQSSMDSLDQARLTVAQDVRTAALSLQEAAQRTQVTAGAVTLAETALGLAKDRYEAGMGTLTEVTNAQTQLIQAQFNSLNAQYDYAVAMAQLQWATFTQPELAQLLTASGSQPEKP